MAALTAEFLRAPRKAGRHEVAEITFVREGSRKIQVWRPVSGSTFMNIDEADGVLHEHFTIILTDPCPANRVVTVNLTTLRDRSRADQTCVIMPGEVRMETSAPSYAYYERARERDADELAYGVARQILRTKQPVSGTLLWRLRKGFLTSQRADPALASTVRRAMAG